MHRQNLPLCVQRLEHCRKLVWAEALVRLLNQTRRLHPPRPFNDRATRLCGRLGSRSAQRRVMDPRH